MKRSTTPPHHKSNVGDWVAFEGAFDYGFVNSSAPEMISVYDEVRATNGKDVPEWANFTVLFRVVDDLEQISYAETDRGAWTKAQRIAEDQSKDN